jgi:hypothetical protein
VPRNITHKEYTIDELCLKYSKDHREYRHEPWMWIPYRFVRKYGLELARLIVWTHIEMDYGIELF